MTLKGRVSPFGNPRIKACSQLPAAYRSVPRPSSPLGAKASTKCPSRRLISATSPSRNTTNDTASQDASQDGRQCRTRQDKAHNISLIPTTAADTAPARKPPTRARNAKRMIDQTPVRSDLLSSSTCPTTIKEPPTKARRPIAQTQPIGPNLRRSLEFLQ